MVPMSASTSAVFLAGMFFGGAMDHVIRAAMGCETTPYGIRSGVKGNWALAGFDFAVATVLYFWYRDHIGVGATARNEGELQRIR